MRRKAQSPIEYSIFIVAVIAALLAMQIYLKRAKAGQLRNIADSIGSQYAPKHTDSVMTITNNAKTLTSTVVTEEDDKLKTATTVITDHDTTTTTGYEHIDVFESGLFD